MFYFDQFGTCGFGNTTLSKRSLSSTYPKAYSKVGKENSNSKASAPKSNTIIKNKQIKPTVKTNPVKENNKNKISSQSDVKEIVPKNDKVVSADSESKDDIHNIEKSPEPKLEKRKNTVLKTIEVDNRTVKVDLYDNGEVDGDSISLFYNDNLLLSNKRLTTKAISLTLNVENDNSINELTMYAENLGTIPPNTALMIITDGPNRYEVRITSDLEKSGVIRFVHKSPK